MVAVVIVVLDEALDAGVEITGQEVVLQQDAVLQGLMPTFNLALCLRVVGSAANVIHALFFQPISEFDLRRSWHRCRTTDAACGEPSPFIAAGSL